MDPLQPPLSIDDIVDNFSLLEEWDDRYRYVIELGRKLTPFPEPERTDTNKVQGCVSQVWLSKTVDSHVRRVCAEYDTVSMWMRTKA